MLNPSDPYCSDNQVMQTAGAAREQHGPGKAQGRKMPGFTDPSEVDALSIARYVKNL